MTTTWTGTRNERQQLIVNLRAARAQHDYERELAMRKAMDGGQYAYDKINAAAAKAEEALEVVKQFDAEYPQVIEEIEAEREREQERRYRVF